MNRNDLAPILSGLVIGNIPTKPLFGEQIAGGEWPILVVALVYTGWLLSDAVRVLNRSHR